MRKAVLKRIKFTKTGKILHRPSGHNHFNARAPRKAQLKQKGFINFSGITGKKLKAYL